MFNHGGIQHVEPRRQSLVTKRNRHKRARVRLTHADSFTRRYAHLGFDKRAVVGQFAFNGFQQPPVAFQPPDLRGRHVLVLRNFKHQRVG